VWLTEVSVSNVWDLGEMIELTFIVVVSSVTRIPGVEFVTSCELSTTNIRE
jgi:hypothetical protein